MPCSRRVFVTGATGLIGKELISPLKQAGFDIFALDFDGRHPISADVTWLRGNLFDENSVARALEAAQAQYLLNMAWCTTGDYQSSNLNFDFVRAGLALLKYFAQYGGKRAVFAGTCLEYAPKETPLKETDPLLPVSNYAQCKNALHGLAEAFCASNDISFGYGRIFYVYGRGEAPGRLTVSLISQLKAGQRASISHAQLTKDYMYTKDIAAAFAALLDSDVQGAVNICTGVPISLAHYARTLAQELGRADLLDLQQLPTEQPLYIVGDNTRLVQEVGFAPAYTLQTALTEILQEKK